jgi:hypothetical protein
MQPNSNTMGKMCCTLSAISLAYAVGKLRNEPGATSTGTNARATRKLRNEPGATGGNSLKPTGLRPEFVGTPGLLGQEAFPRERLQPLARFNICSIK